MGKKDKNRGIYEKFVVTRTDGESRPGRRHHGCAYFVLDLTHDPHALPAIEAYADSCQRDYPRLACDLKVKASQIKHRAINDGTLRPQRRHRPAR